VAIFMDVTIRPYFSRFYIDEERTCRDRTRCIAKTSKLEESSACIVRTRSG